MNAINTFCQTIKKLKKDHPNQNIGRHLSIAFSDYNDLFNISDKELNFALEKYVSAMEMDYEPNDRYIEDVINDGEHLFDKIEEEDGSL